MYKGSDEFFQTGKILDENSSIGAQTEVESNKIIVFPTSKFNIIGIDYKIYETKKDFKTGIKWSKDSLTQRIDVVVYSTDKGLSDKQILHWRAHDWFFIDSNQPASK